MKYHIKYIPKILIIFSFLPIGCKTTKMMEYERDMINQNLNNMVDIDQVVSSPPNGENSKLKKGIWKRKQDSIYSNNKVVISEYFKKYGFLGFDKIGKEGSSNFWLLVQHCDKYPEFQKKVLKSMEIEVKKNNANADNYALLYDRVKINSGKKTTIWISGYI